MFIGVRIASTFCLLALLVISVFPPGFSFSETTIGVQVTDTAIGVNELTLGFQPDYYAWQLLIQRSSLKALARDANFGLIRVFDFRQSTPRLMPCTSWNESTRTGTWDWTYVDSLVRAIFDVGAEPLFCLGWAADISMQNFIPRGMAVNPNTGLVYPESYAAYAKEWVRHFKTSGFPVRYYEISNEPWLYFGGSLAKLQNYVDLYNTVARAMRSEDPNILISQSAIMLRMVLDYWLTHGDNVDFLDFHKYDANRIGQYSDAQMFSRAETVMFETSTSYYGVDDARQKWFNARGKWLPVINSESNFDSAYATGTDPKIQQLTGSVWLALVLRKAILLGLDYNVYFEFVGSASTLSSKPSGGFGFCMINQDNNQPWYPYYVQKLIGSNLAVGDPIVETTSSSSGIRSLAWKHGGTLNLLLTCTVNESLDVQLSGLQGTLNYSKIDNTVSYKSPRVQTGTISSTALMSLQGYTVILLQVPAPNSNTPPTPPFNSTSTIFQDRFESGDFSAWNGTITSAGEAATVVDGLSSYGSHAAMFSTSGDGGFEYAYCRANVESSSELCARGYFMVGPSGIVENDDRFYFIKFIAGGNNLAYAGWRKSGNVIRWNLIIRNGTNFATVYSNSTPTLNQWYSVELHWICDSNKGLGELYVDGDLACSIRNSNTTGFGNADSVLFGLAESYNCNPTTVYCHHCKISEEYIGPFPAWDTNEDGRVNMIDLATIVHALLSTPETPNWDPRIDLNADGIVNMVDAAIAARHFYEEYA